MNGKIVSEDALIAEFMAPLAAGFAGAFGLADDCAVISAPAGHELVVKTDPVVEGVHFLPGAAPEDIAWRALAVNVSDLAAKGAEPLAYLAALSFPDAPERDWIGRFAAGLGAAQRAFGCHLAGGDTDRAPGGVRVAVTAFGIVPAGRMVQRGTARPGDRLYVSGTLGDGALGLQVARGAAEATAWPLDAPAREFLLTRYQRPSPRLALRAALRSHASAAMDLSDGLAKDAGRMARASGVSMRIEAGRVPLSGPFLQSLAVDPGLLGAALAGGDDYEVLAAVGPSACAAFEAAAAAAGVPVALIGGVEAGSGVAIVGPDGGAMTLPRTGYEHF